MITRKRTKLGLFTTEHGLTGNPTYNIWKDMRHRCENINHHAYRRYGGRGIEVCKRWNNVLNFIKDMGFRKKGMTLERINNDGNYCKENCKWSTRVEQANNRSSNRFITKGDLKMTVSEWSKHTGIKSATIRRRLSLGWSVEEALDSVKLEQK